MVNIPSHSYSSEQIRGAYTVLALCTSNAEFNKRPKSSIRHAWLDPISERFFFGKEAYRHRRVPYPWSLLSGEMGIKYTRFICTQLLALTGNKCVSLSRSESAHH